MITGGPLTALVSTFEVLILSILEGPGLERIVGETLSKNSVEWAGTLWMRGGIESDAKGLADGERLVLSLTDRADIKADLSSMEFAVVALFLSLFGKAVGLSSLIDDMEVKD